MFYTPLIKKALDVCFEAHKDQKDKTGLPYIYHPIHLAYNVESEYEIITALLHDVVEDTDYTFEDLLEMGFPKEVVEALTYLTHDKDVRYKDYVKNIKNNELARTVKLADLRHNSDLSRLNVVNEEDRERQKKYLEAIQFLQD